MKQFNPFWGCLIACVAFLQVGCRQQLETHYADARGHSINGVTGFIDLLKSSGHRTDVWSAVSPRIGNDYGAIIIFASHFESLPEKSIEHATDLLWDDAVQSVLIVLRDSDCSIDYWQQVANLPGLTPQEIQDAKSETDKAIDVLKDQTTGEVDVEDDWYGLQKADRTNDPAIRTVEIVDQPGSTVQARWPLNRRLIPTDDARILWKSDADPLLFRHADLNLQILASGTPILNGGFVDPGNRKLAERLVQSLPEKCRVAVVVSSRWSDGQSAESPTLWKFLKVHPNGWIFCQTLLAILIFCWWKLPIFGRPRVRTNTDMVRFGRHVEALAQLLQRTRDASFARLAIHDWLRHEKSRRPHQTTMNHSNEDNSLEGK